MYRSVDDAPRDARFGAAVAAFGHKMAKSDYLSDFTYDDIAELATNAKGRDRYGYRAEFVQLVDAAKSIAKRQSATEKN